MWWGCICGGCICGGCTCNVRFCCTCVRFCCICVRCTCVLLITCAHNWVPMRNRHTTGCESGLYTANWLGGRIASAVDCIHYNTYNTYTTTHTTHTLHTTTHTVYCALLLCAHCNCLRMRCAFAQRPHLTQHLTHTTLYCAESVYTALRVRIR